MSRTYRASRIVGGLVGLSFLFSSVGASAISVNPAIHDLAIDPGQSETRTITIVNDERVAQTYALTIQKFIPKGEYGQQEFLPMSDTSGLPEWMFVDKPEITLQPGQTGTVQVAVRVPQSAPGGGHYAALFFSKRQSADEQVAMLPRLGVLFFVRVNGPVQERLSLKDFVLDQTGAYSDLPVGFRISVVNEGSVHAIPRGMIEVTNVFGMKVATLDANQDDSRVLPGSTRVLSSSWREEVGSWFVIGPHKATVKMSGAGFIGGEERSVSFSVWPVRALGMIFGSLIVLILAFFILKKMLVHGARIRSDKKG